MAKYEVTRVHVLYEPVIVDIPETFQGDPETEARWRASMGICTPTGEREVWHSDSFPWQQWQIDKID